MSLDEEDHVTGPRKSFVQAPRVFSREARFAIGDSGGEGDVNGTCPGGGNGIGREGGGKPLVGCGPIKDILASGRRGTKGSGDSGARADEDDETATTWHSPACSTSTTTAWRA